MMKIAFFIKGSCGSSFRKQIGILDFRKNPLLAFKSPFHCLVKAATLTSSY